MLRLFFITVHFVFTLFNEPTRYLCRLCLSSYCSLNVHKNFCGWFIFYEKLNLHGFKSCHFSNFYREKTLLCKKNQIVLYIFLNFCVHFLRFSWYFAFIVSRNFFLFPFLRKFIDTANELKSRSGDNWCFLLIRNEKTFLQLIVWPFGCCIWRHRLCSCRKIFVFAHMQWKMLVYGRWQIGVS